MNRFRYALLLIAATFFSATNAVLTTDSEGRVAEPFRYGHVDSDFTRRILRTAHASGAEEERGFTSSNIKKLTGLFASSKTSQEALQRWAKVGRTPDYVFLRLKLDQIGTKLMENHNFLAWVNFNTKNPGMATSTISVLTARYGDDGLSTMLEAAKLAPNTKAVAIKLQAEQSQRWLSSGKTPDDVFALLGLDFGVDKLLGSTVLNYMKKFNMANPGRKKASVITTFTNTFGDENLSKMLEAAAKDPKTSRLAKRVQAEQIQRWLGDSKSPDDVFLLLNLDTAGSKLLDNPLMITWERFLVDFNKYHPDKKTTVISTLTQYYGDRKLAGIFIAASKISSTERVAKQLQMAQLEEWFRAMKDPDFVFRMLSTKYSGKAEAKLSKQYEKKFHRMYK